MSDEFNPEALEAIIAKALTLGDMKAVEFALRMMAVKDPRRAQTLMDTINVGIAISEERRS